MSPTKVGVDEEANVDVFSPAYHTARGSPAPSKVKNHSDKPQDDDADVSKPWKPKDLPSMDDTATADETFTVSELEQSGQNADDDTVSSLEDSPEKENFKFKHLLDDNEEAIQRLIKPRSDVVSGFANNDTKLNNITNLQLGANEKLDVVDKLDANLKVSMNIEDQLGALREDFQQLSKNIISERRELEAKAADLGAEAEKWKAEAESKELAEEKRNAKAEQLVRNLDRKKKELEEQVKAVTLERDEARKELQYKQRGPSTTGGLLKVKYCTKREKSALYKYIGMSTDKNKKKSDKTRRDNTVQQNGRFPTR